VDNPIADSSSTRKPQIPPYKSGTQSWSANEAAVIAGGPSQHGPGSQEYLTSVTGDVKHVRVGQTRPRDSKGSVTVESSKGIDRRQAHSVESATSSHQGNQVPVSVRSKAPNNRTPRRVTGLTGEEAEAEFRALRRHRRRSCPLPAVILDDRSHPTKDNRGKVEHKDSPFQNDQPGTDSFDDDYDPFDDYSISSQEGRRRRKTTSNIQSLPSLPQAPLVLPEYLKTTRRRIPRHIVKEERSEEAYQPYSERPAKSSLDPVHDNPSSRT
jgi:hypothetical protein